MWSAPLGLDRLGRPELTGPGFPKEESPCRENVARSASTSRRRSSPSTLAARRCTGSPGAMASTPVFCGSGWRRRRPGSSTARPRRPSWCRPTSGRSAALERLVGRQALEIEFLKGALRARPSPRSAPTSVISGPAGLSVKRGCELMGVPRSSYYAAPAAKPAEDPILAEIRAIAEACPAYGYRRVDAELRHRGHVVNAKKIRRLMQENDAQSPAPAALRAHHRQRSRRADLSFHGKGLRGARPGPALGGRHHLCRHRGGLRLSRGRARRLVAAGDRLRHLGRRIDARLTVAALERAIALRRPVAGLRLPLRPRVAVRLGEAPARCSPRMASSAR